MEGNEAVEEKRTNENYYVYMHKHPKTRELYYIGHGKGSRAWQTGTYRGGERTTGAYGHRGKEHNDWCSELLEQGYLPHEWVHIILRGLNKNSACVEEQRLIREFKPTFNKPLGKHLLKITGESLVFAKLLRERGNSYKTIAEELKVSTMCAYRALTGRNINVD